MSSSHSRQFEEDDRCLRLSGDGDEVSRAILVPAETFRHLVSEVPLREFVSVLNGFRDRFGEIAKMAQPKPLLDLANARSEYMVVEYIGNPTGEITALSVADNNLGIRLIEQSQKLL